MKTVIRVAVRYFACFELLTLLLLFANTANFGTDKPELTPLQTEELEGLAEALGNFSSPTRERVGIIQRCGFIYLRLLLIGFWLMLTLKIWASIKLIKASAEGVQRSRVRKGCEAWESVDSLWMINLLLILVSIDPMWRVTWYRIFMKRLYGIVLVAVFKPSLPVVI